MLWKRFGLAVMVALAFFIAGGGTPTAEARNVYVGTYSDDGSDAYLMTETVNIHSRGPLSFSCTVYATGDYLRYNFFWRNGQSYYRNSWGYEGYTFGGQSPVAAGIYNYVAHNF